MDSSKIKSLFNTKFLVFSLILHLALNRSLPDLELVAESSLLSILRWNYKVNMDKTMCSDDHGQIVLVQYSLELSKLSGIPFLWIV